MLDLTVAADHSEWAWPTLLTFGNYKRMKNDPAFVSEYSKDAASIEDRGGNTELHSLCATLKYVEGIQYYILYVRH